MSKHTPELLEQAEKLLEAWSKGDERAIQDAINGLRTAVCKAKAKTEEEKEEV
jgi:hypothetical protein